MSNIEAMKEKIQSSIQANKIPEEKQQQYIYALHSAAKQGVQNFSDAEQIAKSVIFQDKQNQEDSMNYEEFKAFADQWEAEKVQNNADEAAKKEGEHKEPDGDEHYTQFKSNMQRFEDEKKAADEAKETENLSDEEKKKKDEEQAKNTKDVTIPSSSNYADGTVFIKKGDKLKVANFTDDSYFENTNRNSKDDKNIKDDKDGSKKKMKELVQIYKDQTVSCRGMSDEDIEKFLKKNGRI